MADFPCPCFGVVAEGFEGEEGELTLETNTKVIVVACDDDGWFTLLTKEFGSGIFPGSYLDPLEHIDLPTSGKINVEIMEHGLLPEDIVDVQDINEDGWLFEINGKMDYCPWSAITLAKGEKVGKKIAESAKKPIPGPRTNNDDSLIGIPPVRPKSIILEPKPISVGQKVVLQKPKVTAVQTKPKVAIPPQVQPRNNSSKSIQNSVSIRAPSGATNRPTSKKESKTKSETVKAGPGEIHTSKFSTYRRPVSIFGDVLKHDDMLGAPVNLYEIPKEGEPRYELEGRFEFRATSDIPPPPRFQGVEKQYATGQPSYVDWESKKRSAVFDI